LGESSASLKMTAPRYQGVLAADVPLVRDDDGMEVRIVCGRFGNTAGPVEGVAANPTYLDVSIPAERRRAFLSTSRTNAFAYVFSGSGKFGNPSARPSQVEADNRCLVLLMAVMKSRYRQEPRAFDSCSSPVKPLHEPVAWNGPIVMNTQSELRQAFQSWRKEPSSSGK